MRIINAGYFFDPGNGQYREDGIEINGTEGIGFLKKQVAK
jgi:hypothetical protein